MDFGALPPEVNSARMYSGPGSGPLLAAASVWNGLTAELDSAAIDYEKVIAALHSQDWVGPASALMVDAAAPYVDWLKTTAAQAEQTATNAHLAVVNYETAIAAVVPPPLIAANRAQASSLASTNVFGQYTTQIAALELGYAEMWAQDASAMYSYAAASARAATVTPFAAPPPITSPAAAALQANAVAKTTSAAGAA